MGIGKVEAGIINVGDSVIVEPSNQITKIIGIEIDEVEADKAAAGENVVVAFERSLNIDQISGGSILCNVKKPCPVTCRFKAQVMIVEIPIGVMTKGYTAMFHCHNIAVEAEIEDIPHIVNKKNGKLSRLPPPYVRVNDNAIFIVKTNSIIAIEKFDDCQQLGRFTLRDKGRTTVIGKIIEILSNDVETDEAKQTK